MLLRWRSLVLPHCRRPHRRGRECEPVADRVRHGLAIADDSLLERLAIHPGIDISHVGPCTRSVQLHAGPGTCSGANAGAERTQRGSVDSARAGAGAVGRRFLEGHAHAKGPPHAGGPSHAVR